MMPPPSHCCPPPQELFLRLRPYECLGSLWSQRDKKGGHGGCPSVRATVRHFNRVAAAVVTSCLGGAGLRPPQRARLLEKWIRVAQVWGWGGGGTPTGVASVEGTPTEVTPMGRRQWGMSPGGVTPMGVTPMR